MSGDRISKEARDIALKIVKDNDMNWVDVEAIEFVKRDSKKEDCYADIRKINFPATLYTGKTLVISTYADFELLNEKGKEIVIYHELLHIFKDNPEKIIEHDVEEFAEIIDKFGYDWKTKKKE